MLQAFSQIDLFGKAVLFNYKGAAKSKSRIGAICTLILFGFIIWLTYYFGRTLFDKSNPNATSFESFNEDPAETPLTINNFVFAIGIADPYTFANFINESIYTIYGSTYKQVRVPQSDGTVTIDYIQVPLKIETCTPDHFGDLADTFSYLALDTLYCLAVNQTALTDGHPMLQGSFESPTFQSIYIYFSVCDNSTSTVTCGTQEEIDAKLGYMSLAYSNIAVDLTNPGSPLGKFRDGWYTTVGSTSYKEATLYLEQLEINTDNGFLTTDFKTQSYVKFGEIQEFLSLTPRSSFGYFSMRLSNVMTHYNRSYNKLQDVIAQVNGIVTVAFTILFIILAPYVRLKFYEALINEIFHIKWSSGNSAGKAGKNAKNAKKKAAKRAKKQNLKDNEDKDKPDMKVVSQEEDLEQQGSTFKPQDLGMSNMMELLDKKEKDLDLSIKRGPSLEDSVAGNISVLMPKYDLPSPKNSETAEKKERLGFSKFRGAALPTPLTVSRSQSEVNGQSELNVPIQLELLSPFESPVGSPTGSKLIITPRKPNFMKPNFKVLSYEEHGDDFFDDMHKNVQEDPHESQEQQEHQFQYHKDGFVLSGLRSENSMHHNAPAGGGGGGENKWPPETALSNEQEEQKKGKSRELDPHRKYRLQTMKATLSKFSEGVNLSFCEYLRSWISKNDTIKEKMAVLDEGIKRINERLDIFNLFKKLREFDKLKVLLLEDEQFVLFDSLPKPELNVKNPINQEHSGLFSHALIKDAQFIQDKRKKEMILMSYERLKRKTQPTMVDQKLFDIYDNRFTQILQ